MHGRAALAAAALLGAAEAALVYDGLAEYGRHHAVRIDGRSAPRGAARVSVNVTGESHALELDMVLDEKHFGANYKEVRWTPDSGFVVASQGAPRCHYSGRATLTEASEEGRGGNTTSVGRVFANLCQADEVHAVVRFATRTLEVRGLDGGETHLLVEAADHEPEHPFSCGVRDGSHGFHAAHAVHGGRRLTPGGLLPPFMVVHDEGASSSSSSSQDPHMAPDAPHHHEAPHDHDEDHDGDGPHDHHHDHHHDEATDDDGGHGPGGRASDSVSQDTLERRRRRLLSEECAKRPQKHIDIIAFNDHSRVETHGADDVESHTASLFALVAAMYEADQSVFGSAAQGWGLYDADLHKCHVQVKLIGQVSFVGANPAGVTYTGSVDECKACCSSAFCDVCDAGEVSSLCLLESFNQYASRSGVALRALFDSEMYASVQLLSSEDFGRSTVGLGYIGALCSPNAAGVNMVRGSSLVASAATVAHELGHNMGMEHDSGSEYLMTATSFNKNFANAKSTQWSDMSKVSASLFFDEFYGEYEAYPQCAEEVEENAVPGTPVCGDGLVQEGEECDPGYFEKTDRCCGAWDSGPATACKLVDGCKCAATEPCCDDGEFRPAGTVCRAAATGACDIEEVCTGDSGRCPADVYRAPGVVCSDLSDAGISWSGLCYEKYCVSKADDCTWDAANPWPTKGNDLHACRRRWCSAAKNAKYYIYSPDYANSVDGVPCDEASAVIKGAESYQCFAATQDGIAGQSACVPSSTLKEYVWACDADGVSSTCRDETGTAAAATKCAFETAPCGKADGTPEGPSRTPTRMPTRGPTAKPTIKPTSTQTARPRPTAKPTSAPTRNPTLKPSPAPSTKPTPKPTVERGAPSSQPTPEPTTPPTVPYAAKLRQTLKFAAGGTLFDIFDPAPAKQRKVADAIAATLELEAYQVDVIALLAITAADFLSGGGDDGEDRRRRLDDAGTLNGGVAFVYEASLTAADDWRGFARAKMDDFAAYESALDPVRAAVAAQSAVTVVVAQADPPQAAKSSSSSGGGGGGGGIDGTLIGGAIVAVLFLACCACGGVYCKRRQAAGNATKNASTSPPQNRLRVFSPPPPKGNFIVASNPNQYSRNRAEYTAAYTGKSPTTEEVLIAPSKVHL